MIANSARRFVTLSTLLAGLALAACSGPSGSMTAGLAGSPIPSANAGTVTATPSDDSHHGCSGPLQCARHFSTGFGQ